MWRRSLFEAVGGQAREKNLLSDEHFSVDGTRLLEAWASKKSYQKKEEPHHPIKAVGVEESCCCEIRMLAPPTRMRRCTAECGLRFNLQPHGACADG